MPKDQLLLLLLLLLLLHRSFSTALSRCTTSCGEVANISSPFRLRGDPKSCGDHHYELACINNRTVLDWKSGQYYVRSINYTYQKIWVADVGLQKGNCSSLPLRSFSCVYSPFYGTISYYCSGRRTVAIVGCTKAVDSPLYINASPCLDGLQFSNFSSTRRRLYALVDPNVSIVETGCTIELMAPIPRYCDLCSYEQVHELMDYGFHLDWSSIYDGYQFRPTVRERILDYLSKMARVLQSVQVLRFVLPSALHCYEPDMYCGTYTDYLGVAEWLFGIVLTCMIGKFILGAPCVTMLLIRKWRRRHLAMDQNVEDFLQSNNNFLPIRYSYSDIKKITSHLKYKLGEGGYGFVFKGRLRSGREVAVKILKKGKSNGQDFISEVGTIGRIYHVNVVGLIGFCFESSKQALVYDFMHNGSLDKHIFSREQKTSLDCKEVYKIALGVARGIEYLHRGCNVQILHFDIKPHNILLDRDFTPKVSDFGLARLYPTDYNTVSMTAARGTLGYMAPELVYKNLGGVSYKADVYSFGKLLMEMASGRKNWDAVEECSSQTYFPLWVHDQLSKGLDISMEHVSKEDRRIVKKMIIVALWCIQLNPSDRPSMRKVLEMLEGEVDDLQIPSKPLFYPAELSTRDDETWIDNGEKTRSTSSISALTHEDSHLEYTISGISQA